MGKFINISATIDTKLNLVQSQGQSCLSSLKVHCLDFKMLENHTHQYHVKLIFHSQSWTCFFLFWFAFWGGAVEDKAPCLPFCKKALCCSDLLMPHDPVGTLNKVYDMCNDYQFKNYISFICFCYIHSDPVLILKCLWHSFLCYFQQKVFSNINSVLMIISKWILIEHFDQ